MTYAMIHEDKNQETWIAYFGKNSVATTEFIDLDKIYIRLANEEFIPVSKTFFYKK